MFTYFVQNVDYANFATSPVASAAESGATYISETALGSGIFRLLYQETGIDFTSITTPDHRL